MADLIFHPAGKKRTVPGSARFLKTSDFIQSRTEARNKPADSSARREQFPPGHRHIRGYLPSGPLHCQNKHRPWLRCLRWHKLRPVRTSVFPKWRSELRFWYRLLPEDGSDENRKPWRLPVLRLLQRALSPIWWNPVVHSHVRDPEECWLQWKSWWCIAPAGLRV